MVTNFALELLLFGVMGVVDCDSGLEELNSFLHFEDRNFRVFHACSFPHLTFAFLSLSNIIRAFCCMLPSLPSSVFETCISKLPPLHAHASFITSIHFFQHNHIASVHTNSQDSSPTSPVAVMPEQAPNTDGVISKLHRALDLVIGPLVLACYSTFCEVLFVFWAVNLSSWTEFVVGSAVFFALWILPIVPGTSYTRSVLSFNSDTSCVFSVLVTYSVKSFLFFLGLSLDDWNTIYIAHAISVAILSSIQTQSPDHPQIPPSPNPVRGTESERPRQEEWRCAFEEMSREHEKQRHEHEEQRREHKKQRREHEAQRLDHEAQKRKYQELKCALEESRREFDIQRSRFEEAGRVFEEHRRCSQ